MTESEWLTSADPKAMLAFLMERGQAPAGSYGGRISVRQLRLFTAASLGYVLNRHTPATADECVAISALEKLADDQDEDGLYEAVRRANLPAPGIAIGTVAGTRMHALMMVEYPMEDVKRCQCGLLRDILLPFRIYAWSAIHDARPSGHELQFLDERWRTPSVLSVARDIYDSRRFEELGVLADALEEAGCDHEGLLLHLRRPLACHWCRGTKRIRSRIKKSGPFEGDHGPVYIMEPPTDIEVPCPFCREDLGGAGPHVRGCWALDLILGLDRA